MIRYEVIHLSEQAERPCDPANTCRQTRPIRTSRDLRAALDHATLTRLLFAAENEVYLFPPGGLNAIRFQDDVEGIA